MCAPHQIKTLRIHMARHMDLCQDGCGMPTSLRMLQRFVQHVFPLVLCKSTIMCSQEPAHCQMAVPWQQLPLQAEAPLTTRARCRSRSSPRERRAYLQLPVNVQMQESRSRRHLVHKKQSDKRTNARCCRGASSRADGPPAHLTSMNTTRRRQPV